MKGQLLSIVVPCYNEASCVRKFVETVVKLGLRHSFEFVMVDDGSSDATLEMLKELAALDPRVHYVSFSRNFGKDAALMAGLEHAKGDLVVTMDVDLQHKPELLPIMEDSIEEGYDCVAARRTTRDGEPAVRSWFAHRFYSLMNRYSDVELVDGSMDYRMMTRQVVDAILSLREADRFTKGIYQWVGYKTKWLETDNTVRVAGESKWSFGKLLAYAVRGIVAFSTVPLQMASVLGMLFCTLSLVYMFYVIVKWLFTGDPVTGWPTLICAILMLGGLQLFGLGVLGTYLAGICREVKKRPIYIVRESH